MNQQLFQDYAELSKKISTLEAEQAALKILVTEEMNKEDIQEFKSDLGSFYFTKRKTWEYPESVQEAEKKVKEMKKKAEEDGEAAYIENSSLAFRMAKEQV